MNQEKLFPMATIAIAALVIVMVVGHAVRSNVRQRQLRPRLQAVACQNHLKQIAVAARMWAINHQDELPTNFTVLREVVTSPALFICPGDVANPMRQVKDWSAFELRFSSYEDLSPGAKDAGNLAAVARCKIHGFTCYGDGTVEERDSDPRSR